jgi:CDP-diacylglycerol--glycerol-3-phosphate 3-phosphatidyltransferase/cardiolipin synthase
MKDIYRWDQYYFILPHTITLFRIALIPLLLNALNQGLKEAALGVLLLIVMSDLLDGRLARKLSTVSPLGSYVDAFADFVVVQSVFSMFVIQGIYAIWVYMLIVVMFVQFVLTSAGLTRVVYDPVGKYFGGFLFGVIGMTIIFPTMAVCTTLSTLILCMIVASLGSRAMTLFD